MAMACANSTIINSNNDYNLYYANCKRLNLQSGFVQNLKNKFMAIIESEKTSQIFEEKNIRKYKSLENIEDNCYSTIFAHHKSLESINDSINYDENLVGAEKKLDEKRFDFATIQSKFGKPTESVRKRHTTKINPYNYQQSLVYSNEKSGDTKLVKVNDEKESKVQQIKNMFSKKFKHINLANYGDNSTSFKTSIIDQLESHCTMNGEPYLNNQINIVEKTESLGGKSFVKSSSGIYFYYNKQDTQYFKSDEKVPAGELLVCNDSSNHLPKILHKDSTKPKIIGIASGEVQKTKIEDLPNKDHINNGSRKSICNDSFLKSNIHHDPEGYWRVTRDLVHKIRAKGRSYRFENGKKQELPTTIFLPMFKTNFGNENKSNNVTTIKEKDKNNCFFYPNFNANHDSILNFTNSINVNKKTAYSIVTPLYKETYSIQNGPNTLPPSSKPCRNIINHMDTMDTKRIKTQFEDNINFNHVTTNELANSLDCSTNDCDENLTEEHYKKLSKRIVVFGAYIKLEKNCFLQSDRKKFHRIKFDTAEPLTYEYPSEQSLIDQELENEDVKTRINSFNIKAAAAAETTIYKESRTSLTYRQKNISLNNLPMEHNNTRFEDFNDKIFPNVKKNDTRSPLALYPNGSETTDQGDKNLILPSANELQSQPKFYDETETELSTFRPKNIKNSIKILSFNETVKSDDIECPDVALGCVHDESTTLLHTYPIPADDLVTSKWSITTTHYSDLLF